VTEIRVALSFENSALLDQMNLVATVAERLTHRHGAPFRRLERRIERLDGATIEPVIHDLGGGAFLATVPALTEILCEARALGII
jgi:hypothetical protein